MRRETMSFNIQYYGGSLNMKFHTVKTTYRLHIFVFASTFYEMKNQTRLHLVPINFEFIHNNLSYKMQIDFTKK